MAHTRADALFAVVAEGGGSHGMFDPAWIAAQSHMEYPLNASGAGRAVAITRAECTAADLRRQAAERQ